MWQCPQCQRAFKNRDQGHYCHQKPDTIDAYIALQAPEKQADLLAVRASLQRALPDAQEKISWSMPTYWKKRNIIHFAAFKNHIGLYPGAKAIAAFEEELSSYHTAKGTLRIPYGKVDQQLIEKIAQWCWANGNYKS